MKKLILFYIIILISIQVKSQNINYVRELLDTLCSNSMHGRGYEFKGDSIAADFLKNELVKNAVSSFGKSYYQNFFIDVNTFPKNIFVKLDDNELIAGVDYLIKTTSNTCKGTFSVSVLDKEIITNPKKLKKFLEKKHSQELILLDTLNSNNKDFDDIYKRIVDENLLNAKGIIIVSETKLTHGVSTENKTFPVIEILRKSLPDKITQITVDIENEYIENYKTQNIIGYVEGETDTFIVITAHYDHLGSLGADVYFPGAHDNASGVAMCMDLIKDFANRKTKPHYSVAVIFFSGEELGLLGSYYFTQNPVFPLKKIKFLINIDMAGSGEEGIQVVNGSVFTEKFNLLTEINKENDFMKAVKTRGSAANSDHYFFYVEKVPCFFIYTLGEYKEYHNINDKSENLPLNDYDDYFRLLEKFIEKMD